jgi:transcription elongation factor Elf1
MGKRQHPPISIHPTLQGTLAVNWATEYGGEFICPLCNQGKLSHFCDEKRTRCQMQLGCEVCHRYTPLSCQLRKQLPISIHPTMAEPLQVNWQTSYAGEFSCPHCNQGTINRFSYSKAAVCKLRLGCDFCHQVTNLTGQGPSGGYL